MDLSFILAPTRTQALLRLHSAKARNFAGIPVSVEYGMVLHILQVPQKVIGDVLHHCDQILTYTSGVIPGIARGFKKQESGGRERQDTTPQQSSQHKQDNDIQQTQSQGHTSNTQTGITYYFASAEAYN